MNYYTVKEFAELIRVKEGTVWGWIRDHKIDYITLPGGRAYRIPESALEKLRK